MDLTDGREHAHENILAAIMRSLPSKQQEEVKQRLEGWIAKLPQDSDRRVTVQGFLNLTVHLPRAKGDRPETEADAAPRVKRRIGF